VGYEQVVKLDQWLYQVAEGLAYLHDEGIVHGDLHGGNILLDGKKSARLTDFGMALVAEAIPYTNLSIHGGGADLFRAPELSDLPKFGLDNARPTTQRCVFFRVHMHRGTMPDSE